jgi:hypothetical protein
MSTSVDGPAVAVAAGEERNHRNMVKFVSAPAPDGESSVIFVGSTDGEIWCVCVGVDHAENSERTVRDLNFGERAHAGVHRKRPSPPKAAGVDGSQWAGH